MQTGIAPTAKSRSPKGPTEKLVKQKNGLTGKSLQGLQENQLVSGRQSNIFVHKKTYSKISKKEKKAYRKISKTEKHSLRKKRLAECKSVAETKFTLSRM